MYLVLRPPWAPRATTSAPQGPPVVMVSVDAGVPKPKKSRKRGRPAAAQPDPADPAQPEDPEPPEVAALTATDRALEWRGDDVALPPRSIDMAGRGEARTLDDREINQTITSQASPVKDCVVQGATNTDLRAAITVQLVVDGRGRVIKSRLHAPHYLFEHGLLGCTQRAVARLRFPATGTPTLVTLPIDLG
jgi:hypothetical protein